MSLESIKEKILYTLLLEIFKDGQVEESERFAAEQIVKVFSVTRSHFESLAAKAKRAAIKSEHAWEPLDYSSLFVESYIALRDQFDHQETVDKLHEMTEALNFDGDFIEDYVLNVPEVELLRKKMDV
jgi:uncharacterized tellurite resistance protein B-like protein